MQNVSHTPRPPAGGSTRLNVGENERIASVLGGGLLALWGLRRFSVMGFVTAALGGALVYRGATGHCPAFAQLGMSTAGKGKATEAVRVAVAVTVNRPRDEVYAFWRKLENLPRFMHHLSSVQQTGEKTSHWEAQVPGGMGTVAWDAKITREEPGEHLAWESNADAPVRNAGVVRFADAPGERGTEVHATIEYRPPAGEVGTATARLPDPALRQLVKVDVRRFKSMIEAGERPTSKGKPTGP